MLQKNNGFKKLLFKISPLYIFIAVFFLQCVSYSLEKEERKEVFGGSFISSSLSDPRTLVPVLASDNVSSTVVSYIFNGLIKYDKDLNLVGDLAYKWEILDQGRSIVFYLKENVLWHDGHVFTAEDVEFTFKTLVDPLVPTPYSGDFRKVSSFKIIDPYKIKVSYTQPFVPALSSWTMKIMPKHLLEKEDLLTCDFARNPIGTGPYILKRWNTGSRLDLFSNDKYFEHKPYIDRLVLRIIPDNVTMFLEMSVGNIDEGILSPLQYTKLTDTSKFINKFDKYSLPSFGYTYMGYNLKNPLFKNVKVRQALNFAVNKQEIIDGVLLGKGRTSTGPFIRGTWAYYENIKESPYDVRKAKEMLTSLGWKLSKEDGWLRKNGKIFEFTILTNHGNDLRIKTAEIIQRRLRNIGIKVNIRTLEWSVFINEFINKKRFDAVILGWSLSPEPDCYDIWHSSKTRPGEFNFISYKNEQVDMLLEQGRTTFDAEQRKGIYHKIHKFIYEDQPYMFLYVPDSLVALNNRFKNVEESPSGLKYNFIDWYVPVEHQKYSIKD